MSLFKKIGKVFKRAMPAALGFALGGGAGALIGGVAGEQRRQAGKANKAQKEALASQEAHMGRMAEEQAEQSRKSAAEKERLQREESDMIRTRRKKGRRSLLFDDETGVDGATGLRKTLG